MICHKNWAECCFTDSNCRIQLLKLEKRQSCGFIYKRIFSLLHLISSTDVKIELYLTKSNKRDKKISPFLFTKQGEALSLQKKKNQFYHSVKHGKKITTCTLLGKPLRLHSAKQEPTRLTASAICTHFPLSAEKDGCRVERELEANCPTMCLTLEKHDVHVNNPLLVLPSPPPPPHFSFTTLHQSYITLTHAQTLKKHRK